MLQIRKNILLFIICLNTILLGFVIRNFYPIHFSSLNLFFSDLIGSPFHLPLLVILICNLLNIVFLFLIGKKIFTKYYFLPPLIYALSPWSFYLTAFGSSYIYFLSIILLGIYSLILIRSNQKLAALLFIGHVTFSLYSTIFALILLPILIFGVIKVNFLSFVRIKGRIVLIFITSLPVIIFSIKEVGAFRNIYNNQIGIFSSPGLINNVNMFQGQAQKVNLGILGRLSENKYIYYTKFVTFKFIKTITPSTFFTSQEKLLEFSFSPPVYVGFLIPYVYGLYHLIKSANTFKYLLLSLILIIPSMLSEKFVDLNRLIIFSPAIFYVISFGIIKLKQERKRVFKIFLLTSIILVVLQLVVTISDINSREYPRFERFLGENLEIGKQ